MLEGFITGHSPFKSEEGQMVGIVFIHVGFLVVSNMHWTKILRSHDLDLDQGSNEPISDLFYLFQLSILLWLEVNHIYFFLLLLVIEACEVAHLGKC